MLYSLKDINKNVAIKWIYFQVLLIFLFNKKNNST